MNEIIKTTEQLVEKDLRGMVAGGELQRRPPYTLDVSEGSIRRSSAKNIFFYSFREVKKNKKRPCSS